MRCRVRALPPIGHHDDLRILPLSPLYDFTKLHMRKKGQLSLYIVGLPEKQTKDQDRVEILSSLIVCAYVLPRGAVS